MTALICLSRLYLGVHYFTDVTAGCLVGVGSCLVLFVLVRHKLMSLKRRKALRKWREQQRGAGLRAAQASQKTETRQ